MNNLEEKLSCSGVEDKDGTVDGFGGLKRADVNQM